MGSDRLEGLYRAVCTNNADPESIRRIRVQVPAVFGHRDTDWIPGCVPHGSSGVPSIGQPVWVMFEAGDPDFPVWVGVFSTV